LVTACRLAASQASAEANNAAPNANSPVITLGARAAPLVDIVITAPSLSIMSVPNDLFDQGVLVTETRDANLVEEVVEARERKEINNPGASQSGNRRS
jgi:hypothetical protein